MIIMARETLIQTVIWSIIEYSKYENSEFLDQIDNLGTEIVEYLQHDEIDRTILRLQFFIESESHNNVYSQHLLSNVIKFLLAYKLSSKLSISEFLAKEIIHQLKTDHHLLKSIHTSKDIQYKSIESRLTRSIIKNKDEFWLVIKNLEYQSYYSPVHAKILQIVTTFVDYI